MKYMNILKCGSLAVLMSLASCGEETAVLPEIDMNAINFRYETTPGTITLKWDINEKVPGVMYLALEYYDPREEKNKRITVSPERCEYVIENTRARFTEGYNFKLTPYSETDTPGQSVVLEGCMSEPAEKIETIIRNQLKLSVDNFYANTKESASHLKLEHLCDGQLNTIYHTAWESSNSREDKYIDIDFGTELDRFEIRTWNSPNHVASNGIPTTVQLFRLEKLNDQSVNVLTDEPFYVYDHPNQEKGGEGSMYIPSLDEPVLETPVRYIRYYAKCKYINHWNMAEIEIGTIDYKVVDPELPEDDKLE